MTTAPRVRIVLDAEVGCRICQGDGLMYLEYARPDGQLDFVMVRVICPCVMPSR